MGVGTPISQYEKATSIPENSTYIADMGDGSGTKGVTQKKLTEEVGKALKIGNIEALQTEDKTSLVGAINEAAQSGGGGSAVDILDTKEEIEANTEPGKAAGAQAVKEMFGALNDNLQGFTPVIDANTGKITGYKTKVGGADTVFPFIEGGEFTVFGSYTGNKTITLPDNLVDKNFILVSTRISGNLPAGTIIGNKTFALAPSITKSGKTLSVSGCSYSDLIGSGVTLSVSVTYNICYC